MSVYIATSPSDILSITAKLPSQNQFTLMMWVYIPNVTTDYNTMFFRGNGVGINYIQWGVDATGLHNLQYQINGSFQSGASVNGSTIASGVWNHFALTCTGFASSGVTSYGLAYLNGALDITAPNTLAFTGIVGDVLYIGHDPTANTDPLHGYVAFIKMWNVALSAQEIRAEIPFAKAQKRQLLYLETPCFSPVDCFDRGPLKNNWIVTGTSYATQPINATYIAPIGTDLADDPIGLIGINPVGRLGLFEGMPFSVVQTATGTAAGVTSVSASYTNATVTGNTLLAFVIHNGNPGTYTGPTNWVQIGSTINDGGATPVVYMSVWRIFNAASIGSGVSQTWTFTTTVANAIIILELSAIGGRLTAQDSTTGTFQSTSTSAPTTGSVTTTATNDAIVACTAQALTNATSINFGTPINGFNFVTQVDEKRSVTNQQAAGALLYTTHLANGTYSSGTTSNLAATSVGMILAFRIATWTIKISDNIAITEVFTRGGPVNWTISVSDNIAITELWARHADALRVYSDNLAITEAWSRLANANRVYSDNIAITDVFSRLANANRIYSDNLAITDVFSRIANTNRLYSDNLALNDSSFSRLANANRIYSDNVALNDSGFSRLANANRIFSDNLAITEAFSRHADANRIYSDNLAITDAITRSIQFQRLISDNLAITDAFSRIANALRLYQDNVAITEFFARHADANRIYSDNLALTETFSREADANRVYSDNLAITEAISHTVQFLRTLSDNLAITEAFLRHADAHLALSDNIAITEAWARLANARRVFSDNLAIGEAIGIIKGSGFAIHVSDNLAITEAFSRLANAARVYSDNVALTDAVFRAVTFLKLVSDNLAITDAYLHTIIYGRLFSDNLALTDTAQRVANANRLLTDNLAVTDAAKRVANALRIVQDNVALTDVYTHSTIFSRLVADNLALTDAVSTTHGRLFPPKILRVGGAALGTIPTAGASVGEASAAGAQLAPKKIGGGV
jgi:hypothetical protein